jgi:hypothetical protein
MIAHRGKRSRRLVEKSGFFSEALAVETAGKP